MPLRPRLTFSLRKICHLPLAACLSLSGISPPVPADDIRLPEMGDPSGAVLTPHQEQRLGKAFMRYIQSSSKVIGDPLLKDYIQSLGERLVPHSDAPDTAFTFFIVADPTINAFAGPGGYIGVHTGLILATESESELASVLAHEMAHVTQKHLLRTFEAANRMSLPMAALMLAAMVVGASSGSDLGPAAITGLQAGMLQHQINFTRANEQEADRVGIRMLYEAEFSPRSMPVFFGRMGQAARFYGSELPEFLRTHPVTNSRIADSRGRAEKYPYKQYPDSLGYHLLRATLKERTFSNPQQAVHFFRETLEEGRYRNGTAQHYGYLLALLRAGEYGPARKELAKLLEAAPQQPAFRVAEARLLKESGRPERALAALESALKLSPGNYPLSVTLAEMSLELGRPRITSRLMEKMLPSHPEDPLLFNLLSRAKGDEGKTVHAYRYLAEYHYLSGDSELAAQQLEIALRNNEISLYDRTLISARLREIKDEIAELKRRSKEQ